MHTDEFEQAFSEFLDRHEYDEAENYLFSMVRLAFAAGWKAAGGEGPRLLLLADECKDIDEFRQRLRDLLNK